MEIACFSSRACSIISRLQTEGSAHNGIQKQFYRACVVGKAMLFHFFYINAMFTNNSRYLAFTYVYLRVDCSTGVIIVFTLSNIFYNLVYAIVNMATAGHNACIQDKYPTTAVSITNEFVI